MKLDQLADEVVGLTRGGPVADCDELDAMRTYQPCYRGDRLVPTPLRLVRINRLRGYHFAGRIDDRYLDAGAVPGVEAHSRSGAGGWRQQQVA